MGFDIGHKVSTDISDDGTVARDDEATDAINQLIAESANVLDFTNEEFCAKDEGVSVVVGITNDNGKPGNLVMSFAVDTVNEEGNVIGERNRTTIILPLVHGFKFSANLNKALKFAAEHLVRERMQRQMQELFSRKD